ncbi:MAG: hypothetical protein ABI678_03510 [Kofleriaceae bacterium]
MNRRVLLIDSDPAFRDTLTRELARYKVVVMTEADADRALVLANADAPALILLTLEEADKKAGFRVFEKCKKGSLSKVPIILVTGSVPPESFAKHRSLKVHADEYIDKRSMSTHELVGKIDGLIALGDPDDDLSIAVEDEIPMEIAEGDVVLDEVMADDDGDGPAMLAHEPPALEEPTNVPPDQHDEFDDGEPRTVGGDGLTVDSVVEAETDAAFDMLMGGMGEEVGEHREESITLPPAIAERSPVDDAVDHALEGAEEAVSVPEPILDGRGRGTTPPPLVDSVPAIILDSPSHDVDHGRVQAIPALGMDADAVPEEVPHQEPALPPVVAESLPESIDVSALADAADAEEHFETPIALDDEEMIPLDDELPLEVEEPDAASPIMTQPLPRVTSDTMSPPVRGGSGSHPAIDLGLDVVAEDARSEQSGVYDRRALRKIGELERQIAQLKNELERARAAGETAAKGGRESQFLHLRESMLAKDKELKQIKADLADRESELAAATERLLQAQQAKTALDTKHGELEKRATTEAAQAQKLGAAARASEGQVGQLQQALDRAEKAAAAAEAARAQLEQDLANERATGKSTASEAERILRTEREQMVQRHQHELAATRGEAEAHVAAQLAQLRDELEGTHGAELEQQIDALRRAHATEHETAVAAIQRDHASTTVALKAEHAGEQSRLRSELARQIAQLEAALATSKDAHDEAVTSVMGAHQSALAQQAEIHAQALAATRTEHAVAVEELNREHTAAIADKDRAHQALLAEATQAAAGAAAERERMVAAITAEKDEAIEEQERLHAAELAAAKQAASQAIADHKQARATALAEQKQAHEAALAEQAQAHANALAATEAAAAEQAAADAQALADARAEAERLRAGHELQLDAARRGLEEASARHEAARGELHEQHQQAIAELLAKHEQELAKAASERDQIADAARRAAEAHRTALAEQKLAHDGELQQVASSAGREVAEHKGAAAAARRAAEDAAAKAAAEREEADKAHAQQLADTEAKVERQLAIANGEFLKQKSVADAEHARTVAAMTADHEKTRADLTSEHARVVKELGAERDERKRGLSSARDSLKRSEGELASAVQSIADRNAELRQHVSAIGERDERIAELRKEIEALEAENTSYQEQVLRAYQKIKTDEAMVARARKAMAIALTVLDDQGNPKET